MTPSLEVTETLAMAGTIAAGLGHAVALTLRKFFSDGESQYWKKPKWWIGLFAEFASGALFATCSPFLPVQILMPIVATVQMGGTYLIARLCMSEKGSRVQLLGLLLALAGVAVLGTQTSSHASVLPIDQFWARWVDRSFLLMNLGWFLAVALSFATVDKVVAFALLSAYADGLQFLCTRTLATALVRQGDIMHLAVLGALAMKGLAIVADIHFQQLAIRGSLSRVGACLPVFQNLACGTLGAAFFHDPVGSGQIPLLIVGILVTVVGMLLLSYETQAPENCSESREASGPGSPKAEQGYNVLHSPDLAT